MAQKTSELKQIIQRFHEQLEKMGIHAEKTLLYGSQANGTAREGSDIDLIIISKDWEKYGSRERLETLGIAAGRILEPVQGQGFTPEEAENQDIESFWGQIIRDHAIVVDMEEDNFEKEEITLRLDSDIMQWLREQGKSYQVSINNLLRTQMTETKQMA